MIIQYNWATNTANLLTSKESLYRLETLNLISAYHINRLRKHFRDDNRHEKETYAQ